MRAPASPSTPAWCSTSTSCYLLSAMVVVMEMIVIVKSKNVADTTSGKQERRVTILAS